LVDVGTVFENDLHGIGNQEYRALRYLEYLDHVEAWRSMMRAGAGSTIRTRSGLIGNGAGIVVSGMPPEQFVGRMQELDAEQKKLKVALETAAETDNVVTLHPKALTRYKQAVAQLAEELKQSSPAEFAAIRELVTAIIVHASPSRPGGAGTKANAEDDRSVRIDIKGRLAALCNNPALFPNIAMSGGSLVAGEGLEPPTPGL
jgi:hypothetical protein